MVDPKSSASPPDWAALDAEDAARRLGVDLVRGLTAAEAIKRREEFGANVLEAAGKTRWYVIFARQFVNILILILVAAAAISFAIGEIGDAATICAIIAFNGGLGFIQEWKSENAIAALQRMLSPRCRVIRDGVENEIDARDLVPGDVASLGIGDRVPADLRLAEAINLKADESALTGESESVVKETASVPPDSAPDARHSMAWMGTSITNGHARGLVVATGMATEFGRIAQLTQTVGREITPLQRRLGKLGKQLGIISIAVSVLVAVAGIWMGKPLLDMFLTGVSLAVAVVPEGLPAVVTITLALGIRAMVGRRALMRRLQAAETLGAATVICTDKTGTLTEKQMTVTQIWLPGGAVELTGTGYDPAGHFETNGAKLDYRQRPDLVALLETGLACNHARIYSDGPAWHEFGEPMEAALVVAAYKAWLSPDDGASRLTEFSFNSTRKRMTIVLTSPSGTVAHCKGAPEVILDHCSHIRDGDEVRTLTDDDRADVTAAFNNIARSGLRTLAFARRNLPDVLALTEDNIECGLTLLGVAGIIDPSRPEVPGAIALARRAGIRVIMITGDAAATALAIAGQVGLSARRAITGSEIERLDDDALGAALDEEIVFARATPEHKLRIVRLLQARHEIVGMTGDGVNDAPALKQADIGIAMGVRGTDVAKGAADMVLTDDNFASIIGAIEEGRRQYDNIKKFVRYLLSSNTGEVVAIFFNILLGGPLILLPVQILWMNLVTDGVTAVALGMEPVEKEVMHQPPRGARDPILDRMGWLMVGGLGLYIGLATLWLFHHYLADGGPERLLLAQTMAFTGIIVLEKINVFNFRTVRDPIAVIGLLSNRWVLIAWTGTMALQAVAVYVPFFQKALHTTPLGWQDWGLIALISAPIFIVVEGCKWIGWRKRHRQAQDGQTGSSSVSQ